MDALKVMLNGSALAIAGSNHPSHTVSLCLAAVLNPLRRDPGQYLECFVAGMEAAKKPKK